MLVFIQDNLKCNLKKMLPQYVPHWGWVTHICVIKLNIIGSDNHLLPAQHQAIIWTIARILSKLRNKFELNLEWNSYISIQGNAFENVVCKIATILFWPQCVTGWFWSNIGPVYKVVGYWLALKLFIHKLHNYMHGLHIHHSGAPHYVINP